MSEKEINELLFFLYSLYTTSELDIYTIANVIIQQFSKQKVTEQEGKNRCVSEQQSVLFFKESVFERITWVNDSIRMFIHKYSRFHIVLGMGGF